VGLFAPHAGSSYPNLTRDYMTEDKSLGKQRFYPYLGFEGMTRENPQILTRKHSRHWTGTTSTPFSKVATVNFRSISFRLA